MDLSNVDTAMTTIQHIAEVSKATTKKPRSGGTGNFPKIQFINLHSKTKWNSCVCLYVGLQVYA